MARGAWFEDGGGTEALFGSPRASFPTINSRAGARRSLSPSASTLPPIT